jgi:hypothetical protein
MKYDVRVYGESAEKRMREEGPPGSRLGGDGV